MHIENIRLADLQPSQFLISRRKLEAVRAWLNPADLSNFDPLPIRKLSGRIVLTDGHTRAWAAYTAGLERVPLVWDTEDELDWDAYRIDVEACARRSVHTVADFAGRVVSEEEYTAQWDCWCDALHDALDAYRARRNRSAPFTAEECRAVLDGMERTQGQH